MTFPAVFAQKLIPISSSMLNALKFLLRFKTAFRISTLSITAAFCAAKFASFANVFSVSEACCGVAKMKFLYRSLVCTAGLLLKALNRAG